MILFLRVCHLSEVLFLERMKNVDFINKLKNKNNIILSWAYELRTKLL